LLFICFCSNWCLPKNWTVGNVTSVDYSPDGKKIAVGTSNNNSALIYDALTLNLLTTIPNTTASSITAVKLNNNNLLAIGYANANVQLVNLLNISETVTTFSPQLSVYSLDFTSLGDQLAVCGNLSFSIYNISSNLSMVGYSSASTVAQLADC
jgi:WD40 repeat protein